MRKEHAVTEQLRLMAVHAHPDDESSKGAASMAKYIAQGVDVLVATCTGGERGSILNPKLQGDPAIEADILDVRRKEMDAALAKLRGRSRAKRTMWSRRAQEYQAKIASGDPGSIAEVVRDLYRNVGQPEQSYSERQIYQAALDRLVREFAAVERIDETTATQRVEQLLTA